MPNGEVMELESNGEAPGAAIELADAAWFSSCEKVAEEVWEAGEPAAAPVVVGPPTPPVDGRGGAKEASIAEILASVDSRLIVHFIGPGQRVFKRIRGLTQNWNRVVI